jgi:lipopolysaccharide biosynthesis glycosyltransferase
VSDRVDVLVGSDERFVPGLVVTLRSLAERLDPARSARAFVLDSGITASSRRLVEDALAGTSVDPVWLDVDTAAYADLPVTHHFTAAVYAPLTFERLIPDDVGRLLKLDVDVLVRDDVGALWDTDLGGAVLGAVRDLWLWQVRPAYLPDHELDGVPAGVPYFNAGVQLVDVERWRTEDVGVRALTMKRERPDRFPLQDQALLNTLLWDQWFELPARWNMTHATYKFASAARSPLPDEFDDLRRDPGIVHFTTSRKPWLAACPHPFRAEWRAVWRRTAGPSQSSSEWSAAVHDTSPRSCVEAAVRRRALGSEAFWRVRPAVSRARARLTR